MAIKKSELYSSLWKSCDELRGSMDASQYKDYVLTLLFIKYVSDKYKNKNDSVVEIPEGGSFDDLVALKGDKEIGDKINKTVSKLAEANGLKGVIDLTDFNDEEKLGKGKEMQDRLSTLIGIFESSFDFSRNRADGDDLLGDAYEYLMRNFATESGKSKGQFYTPAEVSRIMANVIGINKSISKSQTIYDPTCGSGSLLLKAYHEAPHGVTIYGQENDNATKALAVMNMWLHGCPTAEIWKGNTLAEPHFKTGENSLKTFDYIVANPPFSTKSWTSGFDPFNDLYDRFTGYGIPPTKNGDYAFLLHIVRSLKSTGKAAIILPHGVLFRGNAEAEIRTNLIKRKFIKSIIGLPANLFYGTGIPACIIVLDKEDCENREGIFMVDASKGFIKDGNKNRLREQDIHKIVDAFTKQEKIGKYSRFVPYSEIEKNEYNLNIPRYIDTQEDEDIQNIEAHLLGGIPEDDIEALDAYWEVCPNLRKSLFAPMGRAGFEKLLVTNETVRETIFEHPEFKAFSVSFQRAFANWKKAVHPELSALDTGTHPKTLIHEISEELLSSFSSVSLIDPYDTYQHLLDYWNEVMQDDVYMISQDGWDAGKNVRLLLPTQDKNGKSVYQEQHDFIFDKKRYKADIIPPQIIIDRYFISENEEILSLESRVEQFSQELEQLREEHGFEEGLLAEVIENEDITKGRLSARIKEIKNDSNYSDELKVLEEYGELLSKKNDLEKIIKQFRLELDKRVVAKYATLTISEIKTLVIDDKWLVSIEALTTSELDRISQVLTSRISSLAERYERTLPELEKEVQSLSESVDLHLKKMGFVW